MTRRQRVLRWSIGLIAGIGVIVAHGVAFWWLEAMPRSEYSGQWPEPFASYLAADKLQPAIEDQAVLWDTAPLFLPTAWNYAPDHRERIKFEDIQPLFETLEPQTTLPAVDISTVVPLPEPSLQQPHEILVNENRFEGFGQESRPVVPLSERKGHVQVIDLHSGDTVRRSIPFPDAITLSLAMPPLSPVTLLVYITSEGSVGQPLLIHTSGSDAIDLSLRQLAVSQLVATLAPGYYKIVIGP